MLGLSLALLAQAVPYSTSPEINKMLEKIPVAPRPPHRWAGDVIRLELGTFRGKPSQYAFTRLGYPDKKINIEGTTVYSWINETSNLDGSGLRCTVKVMVRRAKISGTDFYGNEGACYRFASALDPTFRER